MFKVYAESLTPLQKALDKASKNMTPQQLRSYRAGRAGNSSYQRTGRQ